MHPPTPDPREDEEEPDVKQPPVPPDQAPDIVPQREPPNPGESHPLIAWSWWPSTSHESRVTNHQSGRYLKGGAS